MNIVAAQRTTRILDPKFPWAEYKKYFAILPRRSDGKWIWLKTAYRSWNIFDGYYRYATEKQYLEKTLKGNQND